MTVLSSWCSKFPYRSMSIQSQEIRCTTTAANLITSSALVVVSIDAARFNNSGVVFSYLRNPSVIDVFPSNTISSGGIMLTFTGLNFDVVQQPVLEVYQPMEDPLVSRYRSNFHGSKIWILYKVFAESCNNYYKHSDWNVRGFFLSSKIYGMAVIW